MGLTQAKLAKLYEALNWGCSIKQAFLWAGIGDEEYADHCRANPDFARDILLRVELPKIEAKRTVQANMSDLKNAQWYLERRDPDFQPKQKTDITSGGERIVLQWEDQESPKTGD